jgi:hypothetical protein
MPSYALKIRPCRIYVGRSRWEIKGDDGSVVTSGLSFATEQEAELDGGIHLKKRIAERRAADRRRI